MINPNSKIPYELTANSLQLTAKFTFFGRKPLAVGRKLVPNWDLFNCLIKILILSFVICHLCLGVALAAPTSVRIKDIAKIKEARENQIMGFGLVVGLKHTGDSQQTQFTKQALTNLLNRMGISSTYYQQSRASTNAINNLTNVPRIQDFKSRNVAAVMVTANLPPFAKQGQRVDVTVSSLGDAISLKGGTLVMSPLQGPDGVVYAVAQGSVSLSGTEGLNTIKDNTVTTSGRIPGGAIVEEEVPVNIEQTLAGVPMTGKGGRMRPSSSMFSIVLNDADFTTASRVAYSIAKEGLDARAEDASTIIVMFSQGEDIVPLISKIENLTVIPDIRAKIVINEKTGTIVIGENIKILPVAVTYSGFNIEVQELREIDQEDSFMRSSQNRSKPKELALVESGANLGDLISALNSIGASPRDLISILEAIKSAGALNADIEII